MSPFDLNLEKAHNDTNLVKLEPAINAFGSMLLIARDDDLSVHEWITKTRAQMTSKELFRHKLVMIGLYYSVLPRNSWTSFDAYLENLEKMQPSEFRDNLLNSYAGICLTKEAVTDRDKPVDWNNVLSSPENYVSFLKFRFGEKLTDTEVETRAYQYVIDPAALKQLVTTHIRRFWKNYLQAEWDRVLPSLEASVKAFAQTDFSGMTRQEIVQFVTDNDSQNIHWMEKLETAPEVHFIPNAHIGPYIHIFELGENCYVYFGAHLPEGSDLHVPELDRAEIVSKLSALADETRLQILQMIVENGKMRSNEIMEKTSLSQPSVSRYLGQLTANGYLQERRVNGAKVYTLNRDRIEKTLKAVSAFLLDRS